MSVSCNRNYTILTNSITYYYLFIRMEIVISMYVCIYAGGWICPVALAVPGAQTGRERIVPMKNTETHTCPTVHILGEWIRNFTDPSALNCTFDFQWRGVLVKYYVQWMNEIPGLEWVEATVESPYKIYIQYRVDMLQNTKDLTFLVYIFPIFALFRQFAMG